METYESSGGALQCRLVAALRVVPQRFQKVNPKYCGPLLVQPLIPKRAFRKLTWREKDVIRLIAKEYTYNEMMTALFLSRGGLDHRIENLHKYFKVRSNGALLYIIFKNHLI